MSQGDPVWRKFGSVDALRLPHQVAENSLSNFADSVSIPIQRFHGVDIRSIAVSADGRTIAVGGDDQAVHLISLQTGEELLAFSNLPAAVNQLAFSPDHRYLAAALHNGEIRVWISRPGDE